MAPQDPVLVDDDDDERVSSIDDDETLQQQAQAVQSLFIIRHGDRWDYAHPEWVETAQRRGDPPLSTLGHQQARETGVFLDKLLSQQQGIVAANDITWLSSPFLRTIQTSDDMLSSFQKVPDIDSVLIRPEASVWELDGHGGVLHADLPTMEERKLYFPRVDVDYESLFVPDLPEARSDFLGRCDRAMDCLNARYPFRPNTAIVIISHAAACVGLTRAAAKTTLQQVNPPGPCTIFRLTRTCDTDVWDLDHYADKEGFNGTSRHLTEMGTTTVPWNNFGDKSVNKGYTGPPWASGAKGAPIDNEL